MVKAENGNLLESIEKLGLDGVMNAANGKGPMGKGIAGAIKAMGGDKIQMDAYVVCKFEDPQEGDAYSTISGTLEKQGIKRIIHAVTMKQPGGRTSVEICGKAFESALKLAEEEGIKNLGCTALGTGVGGLDAREVARIMLPLAQKSKINVAFMDFNADFIDELQKNLE